MHFAPRSRRSATFASHFSVLLMDSVGHSLNLENLSWTHPSRPQRVDEQLLNQCSERYVSISRHRVSALGEETDIQSELALETWGFHRGLKIRLREEESYLCFNRRGNLKVKKKGTHLGCSFDEILKGGFSMFRSRHNANWYLGFKRNGRPLSGRAYGSRRSSCFKFWKKSVANLLEKQRGNQAQPEGVNFSWLRHHLNHWKRALLPP